VWPIPGYSVMVTGAKVTMTLYPGMGHTVSQEEIDAVREIVVTI